MGFEGAIKWVLGVIEAEDEVRRSDPSPQTVQRINQSEGDNHAPEFTLVTSSPAIAAPTASPCSAEVTAHLILSLLRVCVG